MVKEVRNKYSISINIIDMSLLIELKIVSGVL